MCMNNSETNSRQREELNKLPNIELDDKTPEITQQNTDSISHKITQTETNKAVLKLKDESSPGPDGVTRRFPKYFRLELHEGDQPCA